MERASESGVISDSECNDPAVLLACALGSDGCPAKCQMDDEDSKKETNNSRVAAGDLNVSVVDYSSSVQSAPAGIFVANKIKFDASEEIELDSLILKRTGLGSSKAISKVWLEKNGVAVTNSASVGSDGYATLNFKTNRDTISSAEIYELVVETNEGYAGDEFAFDLSSVESTAKNTTVSGTTSTFRLTNYAVVSLNADIVSKSNTIEYDLGSDDYVIGEFSLLSDSKDDDRDVHVKSITFRNMGTLDFDETFEKVVVYRDSKIVSDKVEINGKDITISLGDDTITANKKAVYTIRAAVKSLEEVNKTVKLEIQKVRDIVADEEDTNFRATIKFGSEGEDSSLTLNEYKFKGGKILLTNDSNMAKSVNAGKSSTDVVIAKGSISVTEPVELPTLELAISEGYANIQRLVLTINDKRYTATLTSGGTTGTGTFEDVVVKSDSNIELLLSTKSNAVESSTIKIADITSTNMVGSGTYQNSDELYGKSTIAGIIEVAEVTVKQPKFSITSASIDTQSTVLGNSTSKILMQGTLEAKDYDINVNKFRVDLMGNTLDDNDKLLVSLYINGTLFSDTTFDSSLTGWNFNSLGTLKLNDSWKYEIRVSPILSSSNDQGKEYYLDVYAEGTDTNGNTSKTSTESSATLEVKGDATLDITTTSSSARVVNPTNNVAIYEAKLAVDDGSTVITGFDLTYSATGDGAKLSNYKLLIDSEDVGASFEVSDSGVQFTGFKESLSEGNHTILVRANIATSTGAGSETYSGTDYLYTIKSAVITSKEGKTATSTSEVNTYFAKGFFTLSKTSSNSENLVVRLTNTSSKTVNLSGLVIGNYSGSIDTINVTVDGVKVTVGQTPDANGRIYPVISSSVSVSAGSTVDIRIAATTEKTYVTLDGISYEVTDNGETYYYVLNDSISSVGSWGDCYASK